MYCPIPKAACTSWKAFLRRELGLPPTSETEIHNRLSNGFIYAGAIEREELIRILFSRQGGYFKFTVCRNPYDRLRAAYRDLVYGSEDHAPRGGKSADDLRMVYCRAYDLKPSAIPFLTFDQFIRAIEASDALTLDRHWQLQAVLSCSHLLKYDAVLKYENMSDEAEPLCRKIGAQHTMDLHLNKSSARMDLPFSPEMIEVVQRVYARDFARFQYDPDHVPD